ncbi:copper resistance CopC family protein [Acuticoccus kandeliae]|uniref:copper resistance CopC family protein n=1 Tax=Acuticoccus kandeliae TaxID=2073160 RepID=UPI000D3EC5EC|nr:copper resistance CopC family protein [Acuticoccus kandeliae]
MKIMTLVLAAALAAAPMAASAHSSSQPGTPKDGETLTVAPNLVRLNFGGPMRITVLKLVGPDGEVPLTRTDGMKPVTTLEATPSGAMAPGAYEIEWRGMGADGHVMEGTVDFTIAP